MESPSAGLGIPQWGSSLAPELHWAALSLGLFGGLEYGLEPCRLLRCADSRHFFAESPMGFHRTLVFNHPPLRAQEDPNTFWIYHSAFYMDVKQIHRYAHVFYICVNIGSESRSRRV